MQRNVYTFAVCCDGSCFLTLVADQSLELPQTLLIRRAPGRIGRHRLVAVANHLGDGGGDGIGRRLVVLPAALILESGQGSDGGAEGWTFIGLQEMERLVQYRC